MGSLLGFCNTRHPNINFTIEFEENHEIPFLDVRVKRNLNTFTTTVHHKTTFTGLYTKWDSFTPRKYKINLIRTQTYRCLRICSSSSLLQSALFDLKKTLLQNGYPRSVLCYNINHVLKTKETLLIGELEPSLNKNVGSEKLFLYLFLLVVSILPLFLSCHQFPFLFLYFF